MNYVRMSISPIGNDPGFVAAGLLERLGNDLGNQLTKQAANDQSLSQPEQAETDVVVSAPTSDNSLSGAPLTTSSINNNSGRFIAAQTLQVVGNDLGNVITSGTPSRTFQTSSQSGNSASTSNSREQAVSSTPVAFMSNSIGSSPGPLVAPEILQRLGNDLGKDVAGAAPATARQANPKTQAPPQPANPNQPDAVAPNSAEPNTAAGAQGVNSAAPAILESNLNSRATALVPVSDVATVLLSEVATSDLSKLTSILDPTPDPVSNRILDNLLVRAVQEVLSGNAERAIGYLADYATRDPRRGEALPMEPDLAPVRDKIDSMVNRMTIVARMSAEEGLSRAEQTAGESAGRLLDWDTHADVLIKLAHRFFDAGGYANYSRTSDLARAVSDSAAHLKPVGHALAATAAAAGSSTQSVPGVDVPFWASPDVPVVQGTKGSSLTPKRRYLTTPLDDVFDNLTDAKEIFFGAFRQLWRRAPLLVMLLTWFGLGFSGGIVFAIASRVSPDGAIADLGSFAFNIWGIGFLALVGLGFYMRIRPSK